MKQKKIYFACIALLFFCRCHVLEKTAKQELSDGLYKKKSASESKLVYVDIDSDVIRIQPVIKTKKIYIDTLQACEFYLPELKTKEKLNFNLKQYNFDVDFLTIPMKMRFAEREVPPQLNVNLNGAIYLGYRTDAYQISYHQNLRKIAIRKTIHFGYSFGVFTGLGNTFMSPTNTNNILQQEYDGIIWSKGIASILGVNNFTIGVALGFDYLLDKNKNIWLYQNKPWLGLAFGLNLN